MQPTSPPARYVTLRDYGRVVRRYWVAIVVIATVGAVAGIIDAKRHSPVYEATASIQFQDPAQDLTLVGLSSSFDQLPSTQAAENAETFSRPQIMNHVRRVLGTTGSAESLGGGVSGQVSPAGLLELTAASSDPGVSRRLANAVAGVLVAQDNQAARSRFSAAVNDIRRQLSSRRTRGNSSITAAQVPTYEDELARLQTLSRFAETAQVAQVAQTPTSPSSPHTSRSAILGLVLGLLLAIAVAFVRDSMDRRLRGPHEVQDSFRLPILGYVREQVMGTIVSVPSGAADDGKLDLEAFRIIRRNIESLDLDSAARSVLVTSAVPGEGKTTVAGSLAFAIASTGKRTLLVDCDLRRPDLAARLGVQDAPGLSDFLGGHARPEEILRPIAFREAPTMNGNAAAPDIPPDSGYRLVAIPAGTPTTHAAELLGSQRFKAVLEEFVEAYDAVIIDSSPIVPVADTLEMLPHVDRLVVCARERGTTREQALAVKAALARFPARPAGVVITGLKSRNSAYGNTSYSYSYG